MNAPRKKTKPTVLGGLFLLALLSQAGCASKARRTASRPSPEPTGFSASADTERLGAETRAAALPAGEDLLREDARAVRDFFTPDEADVQVSPPFVLIRLKSLQFADRQTRISASQVPLLEKLKDAIATVGARRIVIEGHTNRFDSADENLSLSMQRAEAVKNYLMEGNELAPEEITAMGYGSDRPLNSADTPAGRALNRRIDVWIEPE